MPVAGVDVGSVAAKAVILRFPNRVRCWASAVLPTGWNAREAGEKALAAACADAGGIAASRIARNGVRGAFPCPLRTKWSRQITCHARGAVHFFPGTGVVLDIGGQEQRGHQYGPGRLGAGFSDERQVRGGQAGRFLQVLSGILGMELAAICW